MISILTVSRGRPNMLYDMYKSLLRTTHGHDLEIISVIDENSECADIASWAGSSVVDFSTKRRGALFCWNRALVLSDGDIIVPAGDDQVFHEGWLDFALESHAKKVNGYGVIGMNDLAYDGNLQVATMLLFDRNYCRNEMGGAIAPPDYEYLCVDLEWCEKAKMLGKYYWDKRAKVEHLHSAHGKRAFDELDSTKTSGLSERDMKTFLERKSNGFPITWESLI